MSEKKREMLHRTSRKHSCYVLDVAARDMPMHEVQMVGFTIEEAVTKAVFNAR